MEEKDEKETERRRNEKIEEYRQKNQAILAKKRERQRKHEERLTETKKEKKEILTRETLYRT